MKLNRTRTTRRYGENAGDDQFSRGRWILFFAVAAVIICPMLAQAGDALVTDSFNRTTGLGSKWKVIYGSFTTDGTFAVSGSPSTEGNWAMIIPDFGTNDYSVSANLVVPVGSHYSGIVARSAASGEFDKDLYAAQIDTDGMVSLYRRNDWVWTQLASVPVTVTPGANYNLKFVVSGSANVELEVWFNGEQKIAYTDSSSSRLVSGVAGVESYDSGVKFTNVKVMSTAPKLFEDAFARTTGLGADWQIVYGSYATDGTYAVSGTPPVNGNWARAVPAIGTNDYAVSADVQVPAGSATSGLVARSNTAEAFDKDLYAVQLDASGVVNLFRRNSWNWTQLATVAEAIAPDTTHNVKLIVYGVDPVQLSVWIDGAQKLAYEDSSDNRLIAGGAGLMGYDAGVRYKNFAVESLAKLSVPFSGLGSIEVLTRGMRCTESCELEVPRGTVLPLVARPTSNASAFGGFEGECVGKSICSVVADGDKSVTAYADTAGVTIDVLWDKDKGAVTCAPSCEVVSNPNSEYTHSVTAAVGTTITLTAASYSPYQTSGWTGICESTASTCSFLAETPGEARANFSYGAPASNTITLQVNGSGTIDGPNGFTCSGTCSFTAPGASYQYFTAVPGSGMLLDGWMGANTFKHGVNGVVVYIPYQSEGTQTTTANFVSSAIMYPCGNHPCERGEFPPASWRPYGFDAAVNIPIPANPPLMARSAEKVAFLLGPVSTKDQIANFFFPADGLGGWPTYYGQSSDSTYSFVCDLYDPASDNTNCTIASMTAKVPAGAQIQGNDGTLINADRHFTVIDQTTGNEFDLWGTSTNPIPAGGGPIHSLWAGYTKAMHGDGVRIGVGEGTASGFGNLAGRLRVEEFQAAIAAHSYVNHALTITVDCTDGRYFPPAIKAERDCSYKGIDSSDAPSLGNRLWLDMTFADIDALTTVPEWKKVILRTLSKYGAIINDTGTSFYFTIQTESGNQYTSMGVANDPWLTFGDSLYSSGASSISKDQSGNITGEWLNSNDGIDWNSTVWSHLKIVHSCVNMGTCVVPN